MSERKEVQTRIESIDTLLLKIEKISDPAVISLSKQLVQSLMDLHGSGLERMLEIVHRTGDTGQNTIDEMGRDDLAGSLLLLHGLHPVDLRERIATALEKTRPYLRSHGGNVQLVRVSDEGSITLRLERSCHSCPSSAVTLQSAVEQAIYEAAPDVVEIIVEGISQEPASPSTFISLATLQENENGSTVQQSATASQPLIKQQTDWKDALGLDAIPTGTLRKQEVAGKSVLFCKLSEDFYAYGITCPGCGQTLEGGHIENTLLACPTCRQRFDLVHAGRCVDIEALHLEPIPLLKEDGRAKVAIISQVQASAR